MHLKMFKLKGIIKKIDKSYVNSNNLDLLSKSQRINVNPTIPAILETSEESSSGDDDYETGWCRFPFLYLNLIFAFYTLTDKKFL